jgi:oxygen-dependent protoporphyrinogen oxidase
MPADGVVLAVPAGPAAELLGPHDEEAGTLLRAVDHASVALVTLLYPEDAVTEPLTGTGLLVPRGTVLRGLDPESAARSEAVVTACTYLSRKWPRLARPGEVLVRASVGRYGDEEALASSDEDLVRRVVRELAVLVGLEGEPTATLVARFPDAFPQYRVHHLLRVAGIESAARRLPALAVAGAAYRGVGIPACIAGGRAAAEAVREALGQQLARPAPAG